VETAVHVYLPCTKIARAKLSPRCGEYGKRGEGERYREKEEVRKAERGERIKKK